MFTALPGRLVMALLAILVAVMIGPSSASAIVQFGTLGNFDVLNDTGMETHGFEIELDGITSADVVYEFGAPYERYGNPTVTDFAGGVYVRYESGYDPASSQWAQATPIAPTPITPTAGHACWTGGSGNYLTAGCEHFGLALAANPTNVVYRWLVADPASPGTLVPSGTNVNLPAPVWSVQPAPPASPSPAPVVAAVVQAPPVEVNQEFGEAEWVKVFVTESPNPANLNHLVSDDPAVPQSPGETETEWMLLQDEQGHANANAELASGGNQIGDSSESVTRRYEYYKYTGAYDPETNEALPAVSDSAPQPDELGDYIGSQNAAVNVNGNAAPADTTAPTASITVSPLSPTNRTSATIKLTASDPDDTSFTFFCSLDGAPAATCTSPMTYLGLGNADHTVEVTATDAAGNPSDPVFAAWTVDSSLKSQSVTFPTTTHATYGPDPVDPATASSGLEVSYSNPSGKCAIDPVSGHVQLTGAGTCTVTAGQEGNGEWAAANPVTRTFTVAKATLTVHANDATVAYRQTPKFTYYLTGFVPGGSNGTTGRAACSLLTPGTLDVGVYPGEIQCRAGTLMSANYVFHAGTPATLTVVQASQKITFGTPPASPKYGGSYTVRATGGGSGNPVVLTIDAASSPGSCSISGQTVSFDLAGTCIIDANQGGSSNYLAAPQAQQKLVIVPAKLFVRADPQTRPQGTPNPPLTATLSVVPDFLTGAPVCKTTAKQSSPVGKYPITCTKGTLSVPAGTYVFVFVPSTLTVT